MKRLFLFWLLLGAGFPAFAEVMPPKPDRYYNDYVGATSGSTASQINSTLEDFERASSSQIVVAVFKKMESESSIEDYTVRIAQSWQVGQKGKDNGAVLFVFIQDRTMFIQVGYGLEGALPDILCKRIIENEIKPHFKSGDFDGGLKAGVAAMIAAAKGEYHGTGHTAAEFSNRFDQQTDSFIAWSVVGMCVFLLILFVIFGRRVKIYSGRGYRSQRSYGSSSWGGFSSGSSSSSHSSGGSFSSGGGSFGGGGAGGSW